MKWICSHLHVYFLILFLILLNLLQYHDGAYAPILDATFVMVARDPENKR